MDSVIAIDGPSGSGKSTMAKELAKKLNLLYIDTGAMYRALGLGAFKAHIDLQSENEELLQWLKEIRFSYGESEDNLVTVNGENLSGEIREHQVSLYASQISKLPHVRKFLVDFQRELAQKHTCVMEGRDIGTVVFPNSFCKIYVTASTDVRAMRRLGQLKELGQGDLTLEQVKADVIKRDESDMNRAESPLVQADDAILLDTSDMEATQVLTEMVNICQRQAERAGVSL